VTPGNYPKENILHTEHGESLKQEFEAFSQVPKPGTPTYTSCVVFPEFQKSDARAVLHQSVSRNITINFCHSIKYFLIF